MKLAAQTHGRERSHRGTSKTLQRANVSLPFAHVTVQHVLLQFRVVALPAERTQVVLLLVTTVAHQAVVVPLRARPRAALYAYSAILNAGRNENKTRVLRMCITVLVQVIRNSTKQLQIIH